MCVIVLFVVIVDVVYICKYRNKIKSQPQSSKVYDQFRYCFSSFYDVTCH